MQANASGSVLSAHEAVSDLYRYFTELDRLADAATPATT